MVQRGWSLNTTVWQEGWTRLGSLTWRQQPLNLDVKNRVPAKSGVYAICAHAAITPVAAGLLTRLYNAIYVGKATNLRNRFDNHCRGYGDVRPARLVFRKLDFWYAETDELALEQLLLDTLGPPANRIDSIAARIGAPANARLLGK